LSEASQKLSATGKPMGLSTAVIAQVTVMVITVSAKPQVVGHFSGPTTQTYEPHAAVAGQDTVLDGFVSVQ
jgi:hypothetical protein